MNKNSPLLLTALGLVSASTVLVCLFSLCGFVGRWYWALDLLSHFRTQYFWCLIASLLFYLLCKRYKTAAATAAFALLNLVLVASVYMGGSTPPAGAKTYRALAFNVNTANRSHQAVVDYIRKQNPDVVVLMELNETWMRNLKDLFADYPLIKSSVREDNFGIALLSRLPVGESKIKYFGEAGVPTIMAEVGVGDTTMTLVAVHSVPPFGAKMASMRDQHLELMGQYIGKANGEVLLLGDLNLTPWSPHFSDLLESAQLRDSRCGFGVQNSWPSRLFLLRIPIDHCLSSSGIAIHNRSIGPNLSSDHFPVVVDFSIQTP
jgi:endonuclease/exonuclease/phosphatase (EEP) superfamily protein YafD